MVGKKVVEDFQNGRAVAGRVLSEFEVVEIGAHEAFDLAVEEPAEITGANRVVILLFGLGLLGAREGSYFPSAGVTFAH